MGRSATRRRRALRDLFFSRTTRKKERVYVCVCVRVRKSERKRSLQTLEDINVIIHTYKYYRKYIHTQERERDSDVSCDMASRPLLASRRRRREESTTSPGILDKQKLAAMQLRANVGENATRSGEKMQEGKSARVGKPRLPRSLHKRDIRKEGGRERGKENVVIIKDYSQHRHISRIAPPAS